MNDRSKNDDRESENVGGADKATDGGAPGEVIPLIRKKRRCPACGRPGVADYRPFCSKRCADVDLGRWLKEGYRIPGDPAPRDEPDPDDIY